MSAEEEVGTISSKRTYTRGSERGEGWCKGNCSTIQVHGRLAVFVALYCICCHLVVVAVLVVLVAQTDTDIDHEVLLMVACRRVPFERRLCDVRMPSQMQDALMQVLA